METLISNIPAILEALAMIVAGATALTMFTPSRWDNKLMDRISKGLNMLAGNVLKNKNADSK